MPNDAIEFNNFIRPENLTTSVMRIAPVAALLFAIALAFTAAAAPACGLAPSAAQPALRMVISLSPASPVKSNASMALTIVILSGAVPAAGAAVSLSSSATIQFPPASDLGNGTYTASFRAPRLISESEVTVTAHASLANHTSCSGTASFRVLGDGIPADPPVDARIFIVSGIVLVVLLLGLVLTAMVVGRRSKMRAKPEKEGGRQRPPGPAHPEIGEGLSGRAVVGKPQKPRAPE